MQNIAILGMGLNGLISAILSKKAGYTPIIFESGNLQDYKNDERTSVLTFESMEFFKNLGFYNELQEFLSPIFHIYTFEGDAKPILSFNASEVSNNPFGFVIHNYNLKEVMIKYIKKLKIEIINKEITEFTENENFIQIEDLKFKLILNCKGKSGEKPFWKEEYRQNAFIFNISHTTNHNNIAVESFNPQGPLAILPLQNQQNSAVIWTLKSQTAHFLNSVNKNTFLSYFKESTARMGHIGEVLEIISDIKFYPLSISFAKSQIKHRQILLGDCFNAIHPVAGSSFNMSVKDMKNLYKYLSKCQKLGLDIGFLTELQGFARQNIQHHVEMNVFTHSLVKMFSNGNPVLKLVRNLTIEGIESIKPLRKFLMKKASGI